jgi:hypothetical protein
LTWTLKVRRKKNRESIRNHERVVRTAKKHEETVRQWRKAKKKF